MIDPEICTVLCENYVIPIVTAATALWTLYQEYRHRKNEQGKKEIICYKDTQAQARAQSDRSNKSGRVRQFLHNVLNDLRKLCKK